MRYNVRYLEFGKDDFHVFNVDIDAAKNAILEIVADINGEHVKTWNVYFDLVDPVSKALAPFFVDEHGEFVNVTRDIADKILVTAVVNVAKVVHVYFTSYTDMNDYFNKHLIERDDIVSIRPTSNGLSVHFHKNEFMRDKDRICELVGLV